MRAGHRDIDGDSIHLATQTDDLVTQHVHVEPVRAVAATRSRRCRCPELPADTDRVFLKKLAVVALVQLNDTILITQIFPYAPFMVKSFGVTSDEDALGNYVGLLASVFALSGALSAIAWGKVSDRIGRRPVVLFGQFSSAVCTVLFGFSQSFAQALIFRALAGLVNGNVGAIKAYLSEITTEKTQAMAFSIFALCYGIGSIIGPMIGGLLAEPSKAYPATFPKGSFFDRHPFALPCMVIAGLCIFAFAFAFRYLHEERQYPPLRVPSALRRCMCPRSSPSNYSDLEGPDVIASHREVIELSETNHSERGEKQTELYALRSGGDGLKEIRSPSLRISQALTTKGIVVPLILYGTLAFLFIILQELLPLWALLERPQGLDWESAQIGTLQAIAGIILLANTTFLFPFLCKRVGPLRLFQYAALVTCPAVVLLPFAAAVTSAAGQWAVAIVSQAMTSISGGTMFTAVFLLINNSVLPSSAGTVNGIGQTMAGIGRAVGPFLGGRMFSWSVSGDRDFPLNQYFSFLFMGVVSVCMWFLARSLPPSATRPRTLVSDTPESDRHSDLEA